MAEGDLVRTWMERLRCEYNAFAERNSAYDLMSGQSHIRIGLPDFEVCLQGRYFACEAKADLPAYRKWLDGRSDQSATQKQCIQEIRLAGGIGFCTWRWQDVELAANGIVEGKSSREINDLIDLSQRMFIESLRNSRVLKSKRRSAKSTKDSAKLGRASTTIQHT